MMWVALGALVGIAVVWILRRRPSRGRRILRDTPKHYRRQYSRRNFLKLGGLLAGTTTLAYSGLDEAIDAWHTEHVESDATHAVTGVLHLFGERFWFAYWAVFAALDSLVGSVPLTRWGRKSFEAMVVGLPALWTCQYGLGGARPSDHTHGPRYRPLADQNSASGHTFIAAIPCLVGARMLTRQPARGAAFAASPLVGWSRINDRRHYLSQVLLGYGIAWTSVETVLESDPSPASTHGHDDAA